MNTPKLRIKLIKSTKEMNCKLKIFNIIYSGVNSTVQQQDTKMLDNQCYKNQESVMHTIQKYNDDRTYTTPNIKPSKGKDKCVIF